MQNLLVLRVIHRGRMGLLIYLRQEMLLEGKGIGPSKRQRNVIQENACLVGLIQNIERNIAEGWQPRGRLLQNEFSNAHSGCHPTHMEEIPMGRKLMEIRMVGLAR